MKIVGEEVVYSYELRRIVGILDGARDDLEQGFLQKQEFLIAGEVFDSVLQEAKYLHTAGHVDASAVLGRVVLEDSLRRLGAANGVNPTGKASSLNDELKRIRTYGQPMWRQIQAWLDIGNAAAHGKFSEYNPEQIAGMLTGVEQFIATNMAA